MHKSVLLHEVISSLNIRNGLVYVDCTLGFGGHSFEIAKLLNNQGMLIGLEQDEETLEYAKKRLSQFNNCYLFHSNYIQLKEVLKELNIEKISGGVLLDLGINSYQLDTPDRGFSFQAEGPLDMRFDKTQQLTASEIVNNYTEYDLSEIIFKYGEDRYSRRIARSIVYTRKQAGPIQTTKELANIILKSYPNNKYHKIHPATKTFQALRIEVNKELDNLNNFLCFIQELLLPSARLSVISFHSLEDRIAKIFLKNNKDFKILTKKPMIPSTDELKTNPRSRSAKLRIAEKI